MIVIHQIDILALCFHVLLYENFRASYSWKDRVIIYYIYIYIYRQNLYNYLNEINLCLCYLLYFEIKIAMKTNQRPFAYCQIMLALISADSP